MSSQLCPGGLHFCVVSPVSSSYILVNENLQDLPLIGDGFELAFNGKSHPRDQLNAC